MCFSVPQSLCNRLSTLSCALKSCGKPLHEVNPMNNGPYSLLVRASYFIFVPYTLGFLPYYLSIANGAGCVGIFELVTISMFCIEAIKLIIR